MATIAAYARLVVLGDPGSGKSTLVNWLAWHFAEPAGSEWKDRLGPLVPLPFVLRDLRIGRGVTWDGLLEIFLDHEMCQPLRGWPGLQALLQAGRAFVLLDGLDEIGSVEARADLRAAIAEGAMRYPACRWLLTSRIVGYEQVPFVADADAFDPDEKSAVDPRHLRQARGAEGLSGEVFYVAPFTDEQIGRFARNWYVQREAVRAVAERSAQLLVQAVTAERGVHRLARVPNLLTMMALIHRIRARLPNGRALLYEEIAQAYLQSIDEYRGLDDADYPLQQKKRWLARVAFEMQRRRATTAEEDERPRRGAPAREVLASGAEVIGWITEAMGESGFGSNPETAASFVDYVGRRSGLLLPRGADQFAFLHLSFQEYFAAYFLAEEVTSPTWMAGIATMAGTGSDDLRESLGDETWQEVFVFLFELLADRRGWPQALAVAVFDKNFERVAPGDVKVLPAAALLARLAVNPHSGFTRAMRDQAIATCWRTEIAAQQTSAYVAAWAYEPKVAQALSMAEAKDLPIVWKSFAAAALEADAKTISLWRCAGLGSVEPLIGLNLRLLNLGGTAIADVAPLRELTDLETLVLDDTAVVDIAWLRELTNLKRLFLRDTAVADFAPLQELTNLESLRLDGTAVTDVTPLRGLTNLRALSLERTAVADLAPLRELTILTVLYLSSTAVADVAPLRELTNLEFLFLGGTAVADLAPLRELTNLRYLHLNGTAVVDVVPLRELTNMQTLVLNGAAVADVAPLRELTNLLSLYLSHTAVADVAPLRGLTNLRDLALMGTAVADVAPLRELTNLRTLYLNAAAVPEEGIAALRAALPELNVIT